MSGSPYGAQLRGNLDAYRRYLAGMNTSMRQKVALTAAHLLCEGRVADMGMGSGAGSYALAALYPNLDVIGVDVSETMVELARETHRLPNLSFEVGDIATPVFPHQSLDGLFNSSVLHHVTSFNGYDHDAAARALEVQVEQLKSGGSLIVRDFVAPPAGDVLLDLPSDNGDDGDDPATCSTAALFRRFGGEFRSLHDAPGFAFESRGLIVTRERFAVSRRHAVEFLLRKDYRRDWVSEVQEEYCYFTQAEFEALFARLGLRLLASTPIVNPWIARNRFRGKFDWSHADGAPLEYPATNYIIVGERVATGRGVGFVETETDEPSAFLSMAWYRSRVTERVRDLVRRPNLTLDVLPWFDAGDDVYVLARKSYPRPILTARGAVAYVTEPINLLQQDKPIGQTVEELLRDHASIDADALEEFLPGATYYPSPGGVQEEVRSVLVRIAPRFAENELDGRSGFSTSGRVRAIEARQLLRAAQVGGLPDARLELNVYLLLARTGRDPGPWIGAALDLSDGPEAPAPTVAALPELARRPRRRRYRPAAEAESGGFLRVARSRFEEHDAAGEALAERPLEYVVATPYGLDTVVVALLRRCEGTVLIGIDDADLPAAQCFNGNSNLPVAPAWRLAREIDTDTARRNAARFRLEAEHAVQVDRLIPLGGPYYPSAGVTPEVVFAYATEVTAEAVASRPLTWVPLADLIAGSDAIHDGHLRVVAFRAAHALGLLDNPIGPS